MLVIVHNGNDGNDIIRHHPKQWFQPFDLCRSGIDKYHAPDSDVTSCEMSKWQLNFELPYYDSSLSIVHQISNICGNTNTQVNPFQEQHQQTIHPQL
jgi:hypothetical protein